MIARNYALVIRRIMDVRDCRFYRHFRAAQLPSVNKGATANTNWVQFIGLARTLTEALEAPKVRKVAKVTKVAKAPRKSAGPVKSVKPATAAGVKRKVRTKP